MTSIKNPASKLHPGHAEPTAAWIVGRDVMGERHYIMHTVTPVFLAKLSNNALDGILSGLSYGTADDRNIYDFIWFEPAPRGVEFHKVMEEAEAVWHAYRSHAPAGDDAL